MSASQWRRVAAAAGFLILIAVLAAVYRTSQVDRPLPAASPTPAPQAAATNISVTILAINDFHGNLRPPPGGIAIADPKDATKRIAVPAGGAEHMATLVKELRAKKKHSVFVAAGDLIGASPLLSALFHDEPTIEALSSMGLDITSVGNHEFDEGRDELLRMQNGGCHPTDGCRGPQPFAGAKFRYLAASTIDRSTRQDAVPRLRDQGVRRRAGGLHRPDAEGHAAISSTPSGVAGLEFRDEAETINALVPELKARGVEAIVVLIHEGGFPTGDYDECPGISGPIVGIVRKLDKAVDLVVSGHTHRAYKCVHRRSPRHQRRQVRHARHRDRHEIDRKTRDMVERQGRQHDRPHRATPRMPMQTTLIAAYDVLAKPLAERAVGKITEPLSRDPGPGGRKRARRDHRRRATGRDPAEANGGAVIAFTNPGGIRDGILKPRTAPSSPMRTCLPPSRSAISW